MLSNYNKNVCLTLNYIENFLQLLYVFIFLLFAFSVDISNVFISSTIVLNISAIVARIKKYKSIFKKNKKKHDEITLLAKTNLDCIKGLISRSVTNSYNERNYLYLINVLRKYSHMKE